MSFSRGIGNVAVKGRIKQMLTLIAVILVGILISNFVKP